MGIQVKYNVVLISQVYYKMGTEKSILTQTFKFMYRDINFFSCSGCMWQEEEKFFIPFFFFFVFHCFSENLAVAESKQEENKISKFVVWVVPLYALDFIAPLSKKYDKRTNCCCKLLTQLVKRGFQKFMKKSREGGFSWWVIVKKGNLNFSGMLYQW